MRLLFPCPLALALAACPPPCNSNADCDDGLFCNGAEVCVNSTCQAGTAPDCADSLACTEDRCSEELRLCQHRTVDADGDGQGDAKCLDARGVPLGTDCDDHDANTFPGNRETCDAHDEDCDVETIGTTDVDGDGYVSSACSNPLADGGVHRGLDCDDAQGGIHPGQLEQCNAMDDDCDGEIDEDVTSTRYPDLDHDGYGAGTGVLGCPSPATSAFGTDCDDSNPAINPGAVECVTGGQGNEVRVCTTDGQWMSTVCPLQGFCRPQPNGTGVCL